DSLGNAYVTGTTSTLNFPTASPLPAAGYNGNYHAFVTKLNWNGSALSLVYSTFLGGSGSDEGNGIAVDSSGNAYVTGYTTSTDFPTLNPLQANYGGTGDAFVAELTWNGSALSLVYSTYLGGSGDDQANGIAVDSSGNAYVTGSTTSTDFPLANAFQTTNYAIHPNAYDGTSFVAKLNWTSPVLSLVYSTYLGGSVRDQGNGIAVDSSGNAYVTGATYSTDFLLMNPLQATNNVSDHDNESSTMYVSELNWSGSALSLVYSTYLGGSVNDVGNGIAVDPSGNTYVTGQTYSTDFPTMNPYQANNAGSADAFVAEISPSPGNTPTGSNVTVNLPSS